MLPADNGSVDRPSSPGVRPSEATVSHAGWAGLSPSDHPLEKQAVDSNASPEINATRDRSRSLGELIKSGREQGSQRRSPAERLRGGMSPWQQEDLRAPQSTLKEVLPEGGMTLEGAPWPRL